MKKKTKINQTNQRMLQLNKHNFTVVILLIFFLSVGCTTKTVYHSYQSIKESGWDRKDTLIFNLPADIAPGKYKMEIGVRNSPEYLYKNIWISIGNNWEDSLLYKTDTLELNLTDEQGRWPYQGNISNLYQSVHPYIEVPELPKQQKRIIKIVHIMRKNPIQGIQDIGVKLTAY